MTAATSIPLVALLGNGNGRFFAQCYWCRDSSPTWPVCDELRVLAAAQAAGWAVRDRGELLGSGRYVLVCRACQRARG